MNRTTFRTTFQITRLFLLACTLLQPVLTWATAVTDKLTYKVSGVAITVEVQHQANGKMVFSLYAPETALAKSEVTQAAHPRADGLVPLIDIEVEKTAETQGRQALLPTPSSSTLDRYLSERPYSLDSAASERLASASLSQGLLAISVPENQTTDRLVLVNIPALLKNPRIRAQEVFVARQSPDTMRFYSLRPIEVDARWGNGGTQLATLISIADVETKTGALRTTGSGVLIHQLYFNIDRNFHDFNESKDRLRVQRSIQSGIVRVGPNGDVDGKAVYQIGQPHAVPHQLPDMHRTDGRIDPSALQRGNIHPSIIAIVSQKGADGILSLPYIPLDSRDPKVVNDLFQRFDPQHKAELTIQQAEAFPRGDLRTQAAVNQVVEAVLARSDVSAESVQTRQARRVTQEKGLHLLARIASDFPYALDALVAIQTSERADSTLKSMTTKVIKSMDDDLQGKQKSQLATRHLLEMISSSFRCGSSFQAVR